MTGTEIALGVLIGLGLLAAAVGWALWNSRARGPQPHDIRGNGDHTDGWIGPRGRTGGFDGGGDDGGTLQLRTSAFQIEMQP